jgi:hypothetical protein
LVIYKHRTKNVRYENLKISRCSNVHSSVGARNEYL